MSIEEHILTDELGTDDPTVARNRVKSRSCEGVKKRGKKRVKNCSHTVSASAYTCSYKNVFKEVLKEAINAPLCYLGENKKRRSKWQSLSNNCSSRGASKKNPKP